MKVIILLLVLAMVSGIVLSQEVYADNNSPTKEEKQFVSGLYLVGFVAIYGGVIYYRKNTEVKSIPKREN